MIFDDLWVGGQVLFCGYPLNESAAVWFGFPKVAEV